MDVRRLISVLAGLLFAVSAQAQWTTVHATETRTEKIAAPGGQVQTNTMTYEYFRSNDGSVLMVTDVRAPNGMFLEKSGQLYNAETPAEYNLNYKTRTADLIVRMEQPRPFVTGRSESNPNLQHAKYEGLDCVLVPVMLNGKRIGTYWVDDKDDLVVEKDIELPGSHTITKLSNITFGAKYPASMFRVPSGFVINAAGARAVPSSM
jgi:hypothetical protein